METKRIPLQTLLARRKASAIKDGELKNLYHEPTSTGTMIVKRPGYSVFNDLVAGTCVGQGIYFFQGLPVAVVGNTLIEDVEGPDQYYDDYAKIVANDPHIGDAFGEKVAISGDGLTLAVYASGYDVGAATGTGKVYVYALIGTTWTLQYGVTSTVPRGNSQFGKALSFSNNGNTLAIGEPDDSDAEAGIFGAVEIHTRTGTTWSFLQRIVPSDGQPGGEFGVGAVLSSSGTTLGIYANKGDGSVFRGALYIYTLISGTWTFQTKTLLLQSTSSDKFVTMFGNSSASEFLAGLPFEFGDFANSGEVIRFSVIGVSAGYQASDTSQNRRFGQGLGASSDLSVFAAGDFHGSNDGVYIFENGLQVTKLTASVLDSGEIFHDNVSVSSSGGYVMFQSRNTTTLKAYLYLFQKINGSYIRLQKLTAPDESGGDAFDFGSAAVSTPDGKWLIVGATGSTAPSVPNAGAVYISKKTLCLEP